MKYQKSSKLTVYNPQYLLIPDGDDESKSTKNQCLRHPTGTTRTPSGRRYAYCPPVRIIRKEVLPIFFESIFPDLAVFYFRV